MTVVTGAVGVVVLLLLPDFLRKVPPAAAAAVSRWWFWWWFWWRCWRRFPDREGSFWWMDMRDWMRRSLICNSFCRLWSKRGREGGGWGVNRKEESAHGRDVGGESSQASTHKEELSCRSLGEYAAHVERERAYEYSLDMYIHTVHIYIFIMREYIGRIFRCTHNHARHKLDWVPLSLKNRLNPRAISRQVKRRHVPSYHNASVSTLTAHRVTLHL